MDDLAELIAVARGERPADLILRNAQVLNLFNGALEPTAVAIFGGRIAGLGDNYSGRSEIDLKGAVLIPGFIDAHVHIESTMLRPEELAKLLLSRGTTTIIAEPHEIANVAGKRGIEYFVEAAKRLPIDIFFTVPTCVPSTSRALETSAGVVEFDDIFELSKRPEFVALGEVMNYPKLIKGDSSILKKISASRGKPIDGHCPGVTGMELNAYLAAGPSTDHEATEVREAKEKIGRGAALIIRQSSISRDFDEFIPLVNYITARRCMLATDDRTAVDLAEEGGIEMLVRMAIEREVDPRLAVQMVTLNPAEHYGLRDRGSISPGKVADIVIVEDLTSVYIRMVFKDGKLMYSEGHVFAEIELIEPPEFLLNSIRIAGVSADDFEMRGAEGDYLVIVYTPGSMTTDQRVERMVPVDGKLVADVSKDILRISVVNRYAKEAMASHGFVAGFGLKRGALASSVSHDAHNIVAVGADETSMATAVNAVIKGGGGMAAALGDAVLAEMPLKIAGLMSLEPFANVIEQARSLREGGAYLGTDLEDPFAALSFMTLAVVPHLKITDKGLVDVNRGELVNAVVGPKLGKAA